MNWMIKTLLVSFLLTLFVEGLMGVCFRIRGTWNYVVIFAVNLLTNPPFVFGRICMSAVLNRQELLLISLLLEALIWWLEGAIYKRKMEQVSHPYIFSVCANGASFFAGIAIRYIR